MHLLSFHLSGRISPVFMTFPTLPPLLTPRYWFNPVPPPFLPVVDRAIPAVFVALTVVGVLAHVVRIRGGVDKLSRRALGKAGTLLLTTGLVGLVLYGFYYERVPYLQMRVLYLALFAYFAWGAWRVYRYVTVQIPEVRKAQAEHEAFTKWLPGKK